jgi:hypothetical protein
MHALTVSLIFSSISLVGCGYVERAASGYTGKPFQTCVDGVAYLQFTTGSTVKYTQDGKVANCN